MKKKYKLVKILIFMGIVLTCCNSKEITVSEEPTIQATQPQITPSPTPKEIGITKIEIDGELDDWAHYEILSEDESGDSESGEFDIKSVKAFTNDQYFYLMIDTTRRIGEYVQIDLDIDINGDGRMDYMAVFRPRTEDDSILMNQNADEENPVTFNPDNFAEGDGIEFKMPISIIENQHNFTITNLRIMKGVCCDADWQLEDSMGSFKVENLEERELAQSEKYTTWLSSSFEGSASESFVINDTDPAISGARALIVNEQNTIAYIISEFSAILSKVNIDPSSANFGEVTVLAEGLLRPTDLDVNGAETIAYVTTESGFDQTGKESLLQIDLQTNEITELSNQLGHPTNIIIGQDETEGYIVDLRNGSFYKINLASGDITTLSKELNDPYPAVLNQAETDAYILTGPAREGDYPKGDLLQINLQTSKVNTLIKDVVLGAGSIVLNNNETLALISEFGHEAGCDGRLSVVNIDPGSPSFTEKIVLLEKLCGAHDAKFNSSETLIYFVEVDASRISVIKVNMDGLFDR